MSDATVPHFAVPFRLEGSAFAVVEQDTPDEIAQCVAALVATPVGSRDEQPDYGIVDPTFQVGVSHADVLGAIGDWEPRAVATLAASPDALDELTERVTVLLGAS